MKRSLCAFFLLSIILTKTASSQGPTEFALWADEAFEQGNYQTAWTYYSRALLSDSANIDLWYKMAEAGRLSYNYQGSTNCYRIVFERDMGIKYPQAVFWLGELAKCTADLDLAFEYFSIFSAIYTGDSIYFLDKTRSDLDNWNLILNLSKDSVSAELEHFKMPVNTTYSEFGARQIGDNVLMFSSIQPSLAVTDKGLLSNEFLSSIYISKLTPSGISRPLLYDEVINSKQEHTANFAFNENQSRLYFNRCHVNASYDYICEIYFSETDNDRWGRPQKIDLGANGDTYTTTQPWCYSDSAGTDILYFSSDMPGGYGGMDIWYVVIKDGASLNPTNAGSLINSPGNEITPFYDGISESLYFSSDWFPGLGAFDVFKSSGGFNQWTKPENIGRPFNSPANDIYFCINQTDRDGYLTSNRPGSFFLKGETCCNDIYAWYLQESETIDSIPVSDSIPQLVTLESSIRELLPLTLYFHNDIPDPRSRDTVTQLRYDETYYAYVAMIDRYRKEYARGLEGDAALQAEAEIEVFFLLYVTGGFNNLLQFTQLLARDLDNGSVVTLKVKGFCSPLTSTEYNINLAKRRIDALVNYFEWYEGGRLLPFMDGTSKGNGRLHIISEPVGEALSNPLVSDNPNDARNSVYSRSAAYERRIQISMYESSFVDDSIAGNNKPLLKAESSVVSFGPEPKIGDCLSIKISNTGNQILRIFSISTTSAWIGIDKKTAVLAPGETTEFQVCLTQIPDRPSLAMIVFESNSDDGKSVIYVKYRLP